MFRDRILHLIGDLNPGGAENLVVRLAKGLTHLNYQVLVCSREGGSLLANLMDIPTFILPKEGVFDPRYLLRLCHLIRRQRIDIIHSHLYGNDLYAVLAGLLTRRTVILTVHGEDSFRTAQRRLFYRLAARHVSTLVAVSRSLQRRLVEELRIPDHKVALILNGIDALPLSTSPHLDDLRASLDLPPTRPIIGALGNIKPEKGYDTLINAAPSVLRKAPDALFLIVGGVYQHEAHYRDLQTRISELGLQDRVRFTGYRDAARQVLQLLDVYVLPSKSEGTSIALLEAMASERPIVATSVGGTPDILDHGRTGLLIPPGDPAALANSILHLLRNPAIASALGVAARQTVETRWDAHTMLEKYCTLYNQQRSHAERCAVPPAFR